MSQSYPFSVPSGVNIIPEVSGSNTLGSASKPFATINTNALMVNGLTPVTSVNGASGTVVLTTTDIAQGTNLYYTNAQVSGVIATQAGVVNGLATLDGTGKVPSAQMPPIAITDTFVVTTFGDLLIAPAKEVGDVGVVTSGSSFILQSDPYTVSGNWIQLTQAGTVTSVNGQAGPTVSLTTTNIAEGTNLYYTDARARAVVSGTAPVTVSNGLVSMAAATTSVDGYLTSTDWNTFNNKQASGTTLLLTGGNLTGAVTNTSTYSGTAFIGDVFDVNYVIDGGGAVIASGSVGSVEVPWNSTPLSWNMFSDLSGSISVDVRRVTYANWAGSPTSANSIVGTEKPTITTAFKNQDTSLTSWSGVSAGDILNFTVDATPTTITKATVAIRMRKIS